MNIVVSSWALHRTLGRSYPDRPSTGPIGETTHSESCLDLEKLPTALRAHGFETAELCHFHVPGVDRLRLGQLRQAFESEGVKIQSLLIDDGDISDVDNGDRDAEWIAKWVDAAAILGAQRARVIAGKSAFSREAFERSAKHVSALADQAIALGLRLTIENWFPLMTTPESVNEMLDRMEGRVGLCADFGNWDSPRKYHDLPKIFARAETCHAKCEFLDANTIDIEDYSACLSIASGAGFSGPYVLVNGGPADEWHALELTRQAILAHGV